MRVQQARQHRRPISISGRGGQLARPPVCILVPISCTYRHIPSVVECSRRWGPLESPGKNADTPPLVAVWKVRGYACCSTSTTLPSARRAAAYTAARNALRSVFGSGPSFGEKKPVAPRGSTKRVDPSLTMPLILPGRRHIANVCGRFTLCAGTWCPLCGQRDGVALDGGGGSSSPVAGPDLVGTGSVHGPVKRWTVGAVMCPYALVKGNGGASGR